MGCPTGRQQELGQGIYLWLGLRTQRSQQLGNKSFFPEEDLDTYHSSPWSCFIFIPSNTSYLHSPKCHWAQTSYHFIHLYYTSIFLWMICFSKILINQTKWKMKFSGKWRQYVMVKSIYFIRNQEGYVCLWALRSVCSVILREFLMDLNIHQNEDL